MLAALILAAGVCSVGAAGGADGPVMADRLFYCSSNLLVDEQADRVIGLIGRAGSAGYTGVVLADSKFSRLGEMPERYFANCRRIREAGEKGGVEIIPAIFPIGYSNDLLSQGPDLAEALPVRDAVFVVRGGIARPVAEPAVSLPAGDMSDLKLWGWHDETVVAEDGAAVMRDPGGKNARIVSRPLTLAPYRQYHISVRVRTREFKGTPEVKVLAPRQAGGEADSLVSSSLGVKATQEWTTHHVVFNSLDHTMASVYFGVWDGKSGEVSWDDATIEEAGLVNLVRRESAPLSVEFDGAERGKLVEGTDFEPVADAKMGRVPWPGGYDVYHEPPVIRLKGALPDGTRLRVSYEYVQPVMDGQVMICPSEAKTLELLKDQAQRVHQVWKARAYWMSHDEIRCLNQDEACRRRGLTPGQILAENARACVGILKEVNPGGRIYVWSDMFDPHHNAHAGYYLVNGDLAGSWEGLDQGVIVACWYFERRAESMRFFAERGHPVLIAGYYDGVPGAGVRQIGEWLGAVPKGAELRGVMYTTWENRYGDLEGFAERAWGTK